MSAAVRTNVFSLLSDDVEDAGEESVNTEALTAKKTPAAPAATGKETTGATVAKKSSAPSSKGEWRSF